MPGLTFSMCLVSSGHEEGLSLSTQEQSMAPRCQQDTSPDTLPGTESPSLARPLLTFLTDSLHLHLGSLSPTQKCQTAYVRGFKN